MGLAESILFASNDRRLFLALSKMHVSRFPALILLAEPLAAAYYGLNFSTSLASKLVG